MVFEKTRESRENFIDFTENENELLGQSLTSCPFGPYLFMDNVLMLV